MRPPSKTSFLEDVRHHRAAAVAATLHTTPDLASVEDDAGRKPLHVCARQKVSTDFQARAAVATAKALLKAGADVNAVHAIQDDGEEFPGTALWYALAWGRSRLLAGYLLKQGADPNHCLFALVFADDLAAAKMVRKRGAEIDEVGHGETPLIYAVRHRRAAFAEWLLKQGANPNFGDARGFTALHHAVRRRLPDSTLRLLVKCGAEVAAVSSDGTSVSALATRAQRALLGINGEPSKLRARLTAG
jgi:ankyrin repeat protein